MTDHPAINLVLGGTSGLGLEIVKQLRSEGREVWALGSSYSESTHGEGTQVDLSYEDSVNRVVEHLNTRLTGLTLDSFWWVAGYGYSGDFSAQKDPRRMATVNFAGALPLVQFAWQIILAQSEGGNFSIISSSTGQKPRVDEAVYSGTKFAQVGFARSLGLEAGRLASPVKVALFLPGGMRTPFWDGAIPDGYDIYNDPTKVASAMIDTVSQQTDTFLEMSIDRGAYV